MAQSRSFRSFVTAVVVLAVGLVLAFSRQQTSGHPDDDDAARDDHPIRVAVAFAQGDAEGKQASVKLTGPNTEDDFPAMAKAADGTVWLAYVEYKPGQPIVMEQVKEKRFDTLVPKNNGDTILLRRFDGNEWSTPIAVTEGGLDVWRPTVSVDGQGNVVVAWAQKVDGDWEILCRKYTPAENANGKGTFSEVERITEQAGSDFHVVSATDSNGTVWLAWQGFRDGHFRILVKPLDDSKQTLHTAGVEGTNNWTPSIAADSRGNVYVAWDHYGNGNYDVMLLTAGENGFNTRTIADSPRYEARVHLYCDDGNRLWIAYEEGDVNWGKDYQGTQPEKVGLENLGYGLYVNRTVRVKCLVDGQLMEPTSDLQKAMETALGRSRSVPRLCGDPAGGLWLLVRHHPRSGGRGETWHSYALRYDGKKWSEPGELPDSSNIIDNRPAMVPYKQGVLVVHSSDKRTNTRSRDQDDLYATVLATEADTAASPELKPAEPASVPEFSPVHPDETETVSRMRNFRVRVGQTELRPVRGEFHRHTEYTSHRDQDGLLEDAWRYALDAGRLDWMGDGDHDNGFGHEYLWWQIQKISDLFHNPPHFVAALTYERSVRYPSGHRNVMFPKRGIRPLPRLAGEDEYLVLYGHAREGSPDVKLLYEYLKHFGGICAVHTSGTNMGTDWRDNDPEVEPIVEIYQGHRHNYEHYSAPRAPTKGTQIGGYRPAGFVYNALAAGYRLGFQSSSDHVSTHMSYAVPLVEEVSRQGIIDAFKKRHCYAATDNIILVVRSGRRRLMGDQFRTRRKPSLQIEVHGASNIARVHVIRDNMYVFTEEPNKKSVKLRYTDMDAQPGRTHFYYVRVEQDDGNLAWASPMWITYRPEGSEGD